MKNEKYSGKCSTNFKPLLNIQCNPAGFPGNYP